MLPRLACAAFSYSPISRPPSSVVLQTALPLASDARHLLGKEPSDQASVQGRGLRYRPFGSRLMIVLLCEALFGTRGYAFSPA
jgi:hypothetical protein